MNNILKTCSTGVTAISAKTVKSINCILFRKECNIWKDLEVVLLNFFSIAFKKITSFRNKSDTWVTLPDNTDVQRMYAEGPTKVLNTPSIIYTFLGRLFLTVLRKFVVKVPMKVSFRTSEDFLSLHMCSSKNYNIDEIHKMCSKWVHLEPPT